jgi:perosamine synthetase
LSFANPFKIITSTADPSIDFHAAFAAKKLLWQPWLWKNESKLLSMQTEFANYFGFKQAFGFNRGREGLFAILKALNIKKGDEVIIQAFTCEALVAGILWVGATPVYADIEGDYNMSPETLKPKLSKKTKAVIVQHTFGIPANLAQIKKLCDDNKIFLIEDIAHALGGKDPRSGKFLGAIGIASFTSFGQDKKISAQGGGMVFTNDSALAAKISDLWGSSGFIKTSTAVKKLLKTKIFYMAIRLYYFLSFGKLLIFLARKVGLAGRPVEKIASEKLSALSNQDEKQLIKKLHPLQAQLASAQLKNFDSTEAHRQKITNIYTTSLKETALKISAPLLRYPFITSEENKRKIVRKLKTHHILAGEWYTEPILRFGTEWEILKYKLGSCKNAEEVNKRIINLPTHKLVTTKEAYAIAKIINTIEE